MFDTLKYQQNTINATFELLRSGLWEKPACLSQFGQIDYQEVFNFAQEHGLVGPVTEGLEYVSNAKIPQVHILNFVGCALQLEQRNKTMNLFISKLIEVLRKEDIYCLLVKGQGLSQCYSKPLWRFSCDIDLFFSDSGFNKAVSYLSSLASEIVQNSRYTKSYGVIIDNWQVELHGTLRSGLSTRLDHIIDDVQREVFYSGDVRSWMNGNTRVFLPGVNSDLFLLFTHFVRHFYHHEFVIRQACDWCRFLWTYKDKIDIKKLKTQLRKSDLSGEWKAFAAFVVDYLGMPVDSMPLYEDSQRWHTKAGKILSFIMSDSAPNRVRDTFFISKIFPSNTVRFLPSLLFNVNGMKIWERIGNK